MQRIRASLTWPWTAGWVPIISRACMVGSLLEGRPATGRPLPQAAATENVLAVGNNDRWDPGSDPLDPTQCGASQWDYVNESRAFVMEPGFPSRAGSCEDCRRETLDPPLPAVGGLFD